MPSAPIPGDIPGETPIFEDIAETRRRWKELRALTGFRGEVVKDIVIIEGTKATVTQDLLTLSEKENIIDVQFSVMSESNEYDPKAHSQFRVPTYYALVLIGGSN